MTEHREQNDILVQELRKALLIHPPMAKILLIEDDEFLSELVCKCLTRDNHIVETASTGEDGLDLLRVYKYDLIVLDWLLPGLTGMDVCREYRTRGSSCPILMLTVKSSIDAKEEGLNAGADDYLTKPFHPRELSARVRALLRRSAGGVAPVLSAGPIEFDTVAGKVTRSGVEIVLSRREYALLEFLMRHSNTIFSADAILERVWKSDTEASTDTVRTHIKTLRSKLGTDDGASIIKTVHGVGYKIEA